MEAPDKKLVRRLQASGNGANIHTINKARCYYEWCKTSPKVRAELDTLIRQALVNHDWSILRQRMRKWF